MRMPSLFKYFAFVGAALLALLTLVNFLLDPATVAANVATAPKSAVAAVQHDPRASKMERWRNEQAALRAAEQTRTAENASLVTKSAPEPDRPAAVAPTVAPPQPVAEIQPIQTQPVALAQAPETTAIVGVETPEEAAQAAKLAKAKTRKAKLARERAKAEQQIAGDGGVPVGGHYGAARERSASNQQDQFYYGQRAGTVAPARGSAFAYAPRPSYGPFAAGR